MIESHQSSEDSIMASYNKDLKEKIRNDFSHHVISTNVLAAIWKYDKNVLTTRDVEHIKITTNTRGNMAGAEELLDYMVRYHNWFPCLLQTLRDPDVKLDRLASRFEKCKAELDGPTVASAQQDFQDKSPENDYELGEAAEGEPASQKEKVLADYPMDQKDGNLDNRKSKDSEPSSANKRDSSNDCQHMGEMSVEPEESSPPDYPAPPIPEGAGAAAASSEAEQEPSPHERTKKQHGKEYDFSREETESELSTFPGWHRTMTESMIESKMKEFLDEDGHYVIWYYREMKRPTISVTFKKGYKNFVIHKRPSKTTPNVAKFYFINKEQHRASSMNKLMKYHLDKGILNTEADYVNETIPLRNPISVD
ncbi:histone-lysine N-methyltransferase SETMAR [Plakobranchus ocellatus]|uniref:Histone-lysine N-methyltransferase SETMAR n=1 Tax=Plakobranchus ocellatus TaxID=259542 RepID=A0AAV4DQW3_9GAST|nr:histone-lysine N-methyltransferase SETMAR [Plakobranchus ocellatus]